MSDPFVGEIRMFAGNFAPLNWQFCDGSLLPTSDYEALYNLIGTTYGGGQGTFALPDLRARVPVGADGESYPLGHKDGAATVALSADEIPAHRHTVNATTTYQVGTASAETLPAASAPADRNVYGPPGTEPTKLSDKTIGPRGEAHENIQPSLAISFIICLFGIYPRHT